jgi:hypothetical protein
MENDLQTKYDSLCYATFINIKHLTSGADRIVLRNVDWNNLEHKYVVHIINACYNILGARPVVSDAGPLTRNSISRECDMFGKVRKARPEETQCVDVPELLEFMRGPACNLCGAEFTFGDIYNEYYSGKEN